MPGSLGSTVAFSQAGEGWAYDPTSPPPPFGHAAKKYWAFEDGYVNVNHGASLPLTELQRLVFYCLHLSIAQIALSPC